MTGIGQIDVTNVSYGTLGADASLCGTGLGPRGAAPVGGTDRGEFVGGLGSGDLSVRNAIGRSNAV